MTDATAARPHDLLTPTAPIVREQWYVAAFADELGAAPLGRRIGGEPVVLFRRGDGTVAALDDRCSHRRYPLSRGRIVGDELQCGYHGARFDGPGDAAPFPARTRCRRAFISAPIRRWSGTA